MGRTHAGGDASAPPPADTTSGQAQPLECAALPRTLPAKRRYKDPNKSVSFCSGRVGRFGAWSRSRAANCSSAAGGLRSPPGRCRSQGALPRSLRGDVIQRGETAYDAARLLYNTRFDAVKPRAVVFCESLADVQRTVRWSRKHKLRIVPRSGGHSYGGYSTTAGVIVDVSRLHRISVDARRRAAVGAGARLIDVYERLWQNGLTVPAGTCPTVGIAGLALSGGIGLAARKFGLTCDNLLEATIVTGDGNALVCNAHEHADLYWALRGGGGGSLGIVTRLVFRTHPVGQVTTFALEWPWSDAKRVLQAWQKQAPHAPDGLFSVLNLNAAGGSSVPHITCAGQFFGTEERLRALLKPVAEAGTPTRFTTTSRSYMSAQLMWGGCSGSVAECHLQP